MDFVLLLHPFVLREARHLYLHQFFVDFDC